MNPVANMQQEIADRLSSDDYFSDVTVLTERTADLENEINRALKVITAKDGKIGVAVVVGRLEARSNNADVPGPHFDKATNDVIAFENPLFNGGANGTGKAAVDICVTASQILHHYYAAGIGQTLIARTVDPEEAPEGATAYRLRVETPLDNQILSKVVACTIAPAGGAVPQDVTLTCPTDGASIYYTLDDTYPNSTNGVLYSAPFTVSVAATLRVVAHKTDSVASDAVAAIFT